MVIFHYGLHVAARNRGRRAEMRDIDLIKCLSMYSS